MLATLTVATLALGLVLAALAAPVGAATGDPDVVSRGGTQSLHLSLSMATPQSPAGGCA